MSLKSTPCLREWPRISLGNNYCLTQLRITLLFLLALCAADNLFSQEKIYVQLDRNTYAAGEIIWFSAQVISPQSQTTGALLQVELLNTDSVFTRAQAPIVLSVANGQLTIPKHLSSGWYQLHALTTAKEASLFSTPLYIIGNKKVINERNVPTKDPISLFFYPESNQLVAGMESTTAFRVNSPTREIKELHGLIKDQTGKEIAQFQTWHDGMGLFSFTPEKDQQYVATFSLDGKLFTQPLPSVSTTGTVLSVINHPEGFFFEIHTNEKSVDHQEAKLIGLLQGVEVFKTSLTLTNQQVQGVLKTKNLHSGILEIQLQSAKGELIAKRNVFINNEEYRIAAQINIDTLNTSPKAKNSWKLQLKDTIQGNISLSITDADRDFFVYRPPSIISQLLLSAELKEPVNNPDWYFNTTPDSAEIGLDLLMLTCQKKENNKELFSPTKGFITIKGQAFLRDSRQPLANSQLIAVLSSKNIRNQIFLPTTDKEGKFIIDSLLFFGQARFFFGEKRNKKLPRFIDIRLQEKSIPIIHLDSTIPSTPALLNRYDAEPAQSLQDETRQRIQEAEGRMLEEVTLTVKKKSPLEKLEEEYTSGAFNTNAFVERVIDFVNTDELTGYPSFFDYLRTRIPGVVVAEPDYTSKPPDPGQPGFDPRNDPTKYRLFFRQMTSMSTMGNPPMVVFLNEVETDADLLLTIPTNDIAYVKIFSSFAAAAGSAPGGAIAIYTKKPYHATDTVGSAVTFTGYSENATFQSPNYLIDTTLLQKPDYRITLDWRPTLFLNNVNPTIPIHFYNNDRTKRFRVIVQGITANGKLIYKEEIVQ